MDPRRIVARRELLQRSGQGLGFGTAEQGLLDRNGDLNRLEVGYEFRLAGDRQILTPKAVYRDADLDGRAMANDGYGASLNYIFLQDQRLRWVFNVAYQTHDYDKVNPVYGQRDDANQYGISATAFYSAPFGWKPWALNATAAYFKENHDIDFYDTSVAAFTVGLFRRF